MSEEKFIDKTSSNQVISGIYKIENLINHKVYIGQSKNIYKRWQQHKNHAKHEKYKYVLYQAIRKYGIENFSFEILIETYDRNYWEKFLIQIYHATDNKFGYNISLGGDSFNNWTDDMIERMASKHRKFNILCINTKEINYRNGWLKLGYSTHFEKYKDGEGFYYNDIEIHKYKNKFFVKSDNLTNEFIEYCFSQLDNIKIQYEKWLKSKIQKMVELSVKTTKGKPMSESHRQNLTIARNKIKEEPKRSFAKCKETGEIYSIGEWNKLGYFNLKRILDCKDKTCHKLHFIKATKLEYEEFLKNNPNKQENFEKIKNNKIIKEKIYVKCIENGDIYLITDWKKLGYNEIYKVVRGESKSTKNKHFEVVNESDYVEFINNNPNKILTFKNNHNVIYARCIESNEIYTNSEWKLLGYTIVDKVIRGECKSCKDLHFVKATKLEFENYKKEHTTIDEEIINKRENVIKDSVYIKCLETNDILSLSEWKKLGFNNIYNSLNGGHLHKGKHFIRVTKEEYSLYLKKDVSKSDIIERNKPIVIIYEPIYAKCVETSEIYTDSEWRRLGYNHVKYIIEGKRNIEKGKHFIKSTKEEYESYLKQLSSEST